MPKREHAALAKRAKELGLTGDKFNAYVYGTLDKIEKRRQQKRRKTKEKGYTLE